MNDVHYWAFQANPRLYRIEDAVLELQCDSWDTKGRDVAAGDRVLIWKAKGDDPIRGIVALCEILSDPAPLPGDSEYSVDPFAFRTTEDRVLVRYVRPSGLPLWLGGRADAILYSLNVSRARGTVFHVTPEQWALVVEAAGGWPQENTGVEGEDARAAINDLVRAKGFQSSPQVRRAVELHAMERARAYLEEKGWLVEDVSARKSYDLHCTRSTGEELRVEVKGTESDRSAVLLTPNEVDHASANHPQVALVVVSEIKVTGPNNAPVAHGGSVRAWNPWTLGDGELTAIGYRFKPPIAE